jgi:hypothetical protein
MRCEEQKDLSNGTHRGCDAQDARLVEKLLHIHALHGWKELEQERAAQHRA